MKVEWEVYEFLDGYTNFHVSNLEDDVEFFINIINRYLRQFGDYELISVQEIVYHNTDYKDYYFFSNLNYTLFYQEDSGIKKFSIDRL